MSTHYAKLLRRTLFAAGSGLLLATALPAAAQGTVTLSSGASCQYSQMTVQPNGSITVQCTTSNPNPTPTDPDATHFTASVASTGLPGSTQQVTIARASSGTAAGVNIKWAYSGSCTTTYMSNNIVLAQGGQWRENFTLGQSGTCNITLTVGSPHTASNASITVSTNPPPSEPPPSGIPIVPGCPAPTAGAILRDLPFGGSPDQLKMKSGTIAVYPVIPQSAASSSFSSVKFTQGQMASTPASATTEYWVSMCPGVIQSSVAQCYRRSTFVNQNEIIMYTKTKPEWGWTDQTKMNDCLADAAQGQWYVNVRWTFPSCPWGDGACGFSMQWAIGPW